MRGLLRRERALRTEAVSLFLAQLVPLRSSLVTSDSSATFPPFGSFEPSDSFGSSAASGTADAGGNAAAAAAAGGGGGGCGGGGPASGGLGAVRMGGHDDLVLAYALEVLEY